MDNNRPFLGVLIDYEKTEEAENGIYLDGVVENSGAAKAGLQEGDVITAINGESVGTLSQLKEVLGTAEVGDAAAISYKRNGVKQTSTAILGKHEMPQEIEIEIEGDSENSFKWVSKNINVHDCPEGCNSSCCNPTKKAFLGVLLDLEEDVEVIGDEEFVERSPGNIITKVVENSAASEAGLQEGDVIIKISDASIESYEDIAGALDGAQPGEAVVIVVNRSGKNVTAKATLKSRAESSDFLKEFEATEHEHEEKIEEQYVMAHPGSASCNKKASHKAFLGVILEMKETRTVEGDNEWVEKTAGNVITKVVENSAAFAAGLQAGDEIVKIDDHSIADAHEITDALTDAQPGDEIAITYVRDGQTHTTNTTLKSRAESAEFLNDFEGERIEKRIEKRHGDYASAKCNKAQSSNCTSQKWASKGNENKALLGVFTETVDDEIASQKDVEVAGVLITKIIENSAAFEAGLQKGDVLLMIDKHQILNPGHLADVIGQYEPNDKVKVKLVREGKTKKLAATLQANEPSEKSSRCNSTNAQGWRNWCVKTYTCDEVEKTVTEEDGVMIEEMEIKLDGNGEAENKVVKIKIVIMDPDEKEMEIATEALENDEMTAANKTVNTGDLAVSNISFSPNPNNGRFALNFDLPETGVTTVRILDLNGKMVYEDVLGEFSGTYDKEIDISDNYKGLYLLQVIQNEKAMTKKILFQ